MSSRDTGKTMVDASLGEIIITCEKITWLLSEGEHWLKPEYRGCGRSMIHKSSRIEFHPLGVIGANPFHNIFNSMLAAVFSGNGIVIKVSEHVSWSGCFYLRIIQAALAAVEAPENLVDVITGFYETGEALVSSVDKVIFVGSPVVGSMVWPYLSL